MTAITEQRRGIRKPYGGIKEPALNAGNWTATVSAENNQYEVTSITGHFAQSGTQRAAARLRNGQIAFGVENGVINIAAGYLHEFMANCMRDGNIRVSVIGEGRMLHELIPQKKAKPLPVIDGSAVRPASKTSGSTPQTLFNF